MTISSTTRIVSVECGNCGVLFGLTESMHGQVQRNGKSFYCPNGHRISYSESENDRLKNRLKWAEVQRDRERNNHQYTKDRLRTTKAAHTKTKKRIHNGVCPHCNRHFVNVERHMASQHLDVVGEGRS